MTKTFCIMMGTKFLSPATVKDHSFIAKVALMFLLIGVLSKKFVTSNLNVLQNEHSLIYERLRELFQSRTDTISTDNLPIFSASEFDPQDANSFHKLRMVFFGIICTVISILLLH